MIVETAMVTATILPEFLSDLLPERLSQYLGDLLDDSFYMPGYKGPLILIVGGSAMLGFTLLLSLMFQQQNPNVPGAAHANPAMAYPHHLDRQRRARFVHETRRTGHRSHEARPRRSGAAHQTEPPAQGQSVFPAQSTPGPKKPTKVKRNRVKQDKRSTQPRPLVHESHLGSEPSKNPAKPPQTAHESRLGPEPSKNPAKPPQTAHESHLGPEPSKNPAKPPQTAHESRLFASSTSEPPENAPGGQASHAQERDNRPVRTTDAKTEKRPTKVTRKSVRAMKKSAKASGFGRGDHLIAPGGRHAIQLNQCKSCQDDAPGDEGCETERRVLQGALRKDDPHGRVVELACDPYRPGRCRFEIIPGGST